MIELLAGIVGIIREFLDFLYGRRSLIVRWIKRADDPDLQPALHLLRTPPEGARYWLAANQLDSDVEMVRWLQEVEHETREHRCRLIDYLIVSKLKTRRDTKICGVLYCHYYTDHKLMFISYIVVDSSIREARDGRAAGEMLQFLLRRRKKELKDMEGIVFELESPGNGKKHDECLGRWRRFQSLAQQQGIVVKRIDINYLQPQLSKWDDSYREERQLLMYGRTQPPPLGDKVRRDEVERVLSFTYRAVYGDCFEDHPAKDQEYRSYLDGLYAKSVAALKDEVSLSPFPYNRKRSGAHVP